MNDYNQSDLFQKSVLRNRIKIDKKRYTKKSKSTLIALQSLISSKIESKHYYYINFFQLNVINQLLKKL